MCIEHAPSQAETGTEGASKAWPRRQSSMCAAFSYYIHRFSLNSDFKTSKIKNGSSHTKARRDKEEVATILVDCAFKLHRDLGPGQLNAYAPIQSRVIHRKLGSFLLL